MIFSVTDLADYFTNSFQASKTNELKILFNCI